MLYKYCDSSGFDILEKRRIKAGKILGFDDPFEVRWAWDIADAPKNFSAYHTKTPVILEYWKQRLDREGVTYNSENLDEIFEKIPLSFLRDMKMLAESLIQRWDRDLGVACFSKTPHSIQLWSHYASKHCGIVVGIDANTAFGSVPALFEVRYETHMPLLPIIVGSSPEKEAQIAKDLMNIMTTKEKSWSWQEEFRLYLETRGRAPDSDGNFYQTLPKESIREVYIGLKDPDDSLLNRALLLKQNEFPHLRIFKMAATENAYTIQPNEVK